MVCLDTHVLLWWALDPDRLSPQAAAACDEMESSYGYVSAISFWELGLKIKQRKLDIGMSIESFNEKVFQCAFLEVVPVCASLWLKNLELDWDHRDPADRTIVATALTKKVPLITADETIQSSGIVDWTW